MLKFIGEIITPYETIDACPRNVSKDGPLCSLVLDKQYQAGLNGLEVGSKILILYWFDITEDCEMEQTSRVDGIKRGVFALRSPHRPNPIGAAVLKIESISENIVQVQGLDCVSGTKLLDIKPAMKAE